MSEGMIIRRGGGASLKATDALLRVQAPAGSTVTITKGSVSKTDLGHENADDHTVYDYYFIIHQSQFDSQNAWTVTATLSGDTASDTIIIDAADEYDVELSYRFYIYNLGDEVSAVTGGYSSNNNGNGTNTFTKYDTYMTLYSKSTGGAGNICCYTANSIDLTGYNTLKMLYDFEGDTNGGGEIGIKETAPTSGGYSGSQVYVATQGFNEVGTDLVVSLDISTVSQSLYVVVRHWITTNNHTRTDRIKQIWLE